MRIRNQRAILCCALLSPVAFVGQEPPHPEHEHVWDYGEAHGPSHWGDLKPEFAPCKLGHHQSPIDIRNAQKADLPPIQFDYKPAALNIIDNGHTIEVDYGPGSSITVGGRKYELRQFHFHRPSEETINGVSDAMEVHFVHADQEGRLAVVAVHVVAGKDNPLIHEVWNDLPKEKDKEEHLNNIRIDASKLLPADRGYYTFTGSLTTPPCTENVTWFVLKHPVTVTRAEIAQFAKLYRNDARPTQPLYDRVVLESK
jgi:carbonic anhydrase